jgi:hypothetical protein
MGDSKEYFTGKKRGLSLQQTRNLVLLRGAAGCTGPRRTRERLVVGT